MSTPSSHQIDPARLCRWLMAVAVGLVLLHLLIQGLAEASGHDYMLGLVPLLDLDVERNVPTHFSVSLLLLNAIAVLVVGLRAGGRQWRLLALLLLAMSIDELVGLHETAVAPMRALLGPHASGILHFAWVLPAVPLLSLLAVVLYRFVRELPAALRRGMIVAAALYFGGAVGIEMLGGRHHAAHGADVLYRLGWVPLEEFMEMAGAVLLLRSLLFELGRQGELRLRFSATVSALQGRHSAVVRAGRYNAPGPPAGLARSTSITASTLPASVIDRSARP